VILTPHPQRLRGRVAAVAPVSTSMFEIDLELDGRPDFLPGQFCMLNLDDGREMVLSRPFSVLDARQRRLRLLLKVVGEGTRRLVDAGAGAPVACLGPLGTPFPPPAGDRAQLLLAGGVGLPPLLAWHRRWGGEADLALFGGRDGGDVPWDLLDDGWRCSVDSPADLPDGREAFTGTVVDLARHLLDDAPRRVLACGPLPLLRAAAVLAAERDWECLVSVEERMGCGYGVCRGCVVPRADGDGWITACKDGPVLEAGRVDWTRFGHAAPAAGCACAPGGERS